MGTSRATLEYLRIMETSCSPDSRFLEGELAPYPRSYDGELAPFADPTNVNSRLIPDGVFKLHNYITIV